METDTSHGENMPNSDSMTMDSMPEDSMLEDSMPNESVSLLTEVNSRPG